MKNCQKLWKSDEVWVIKQTDSSIRQTKQNRRKLFVIVEDFADYIPNEASLTFCIYTLLEILRKDF